MINDHEKNISLYCRRTTSKEETHLKKFLKNEFNLFQILAHQASIQQSRWLAGPEVVLANLNTV